MTNKDQKALIVAFRGGHLTVDDRGQPTSHMRPGGRYDPGYSRLLKKNNQRQTYTITVGNRSIRATNEELVWLSYKVPFPENLKVVRKNPKEKRLTKASLKLVPKSRPRVPDQVLADVLDAFNEGLSYREIAKELDLKKTTVSRILEYHYLVDKAARITNRPQEQYEWAKRCLERSDAPAWQALFKFYRDSLKEKYELVD